jgi:hypothetical protein
VPSTGFFLTPVRALGAKLGHYPARVVFYTSTTSKP